jgi:hypothetical protein
MCQCGQPAAQKTSRTVANPDREFIKCAMADQGGCGFFAWLDEAEPAKTHDITIGCTTQRADSSCITQAEHDGVLVLLRAVDWGRIHNTSRANVIPDGASYCCSFIFGPNMKAGGAPRARSHCRFLLPLIHLIIPDLLT